MTPVVYRISAASFDVAVWNGAVPSGPVVYSPQRQPLNAITVTPDGRQALYVNAYAGTLHALDIARRQVTTVTMPQALYAVNALLAVADPLLKGGVALYALSAGNNVVSVIGMDNDLKAARIRLHASKHLNQPLSATWVNGTLWATNSQLLTHPELGADTVPPRPHTLARLDNAYFAQQANNPVLDRVLGP